MSRENDTALLSVIVMAYCHEHYISECLDSILHQQTEFHFEIILGEDFSNDETRKICIKYANEYPNRIKLFLRSRDNVLYINGVPTGRYNFIECLKACSGKYVAICDGDDYWTDPLKLQKQVDFLESNTDYVLCFHKIKILQPDGKAVDDYITQVPQQYETIEALVTQGNYIHTPSVVFRNVLKDLPFEFEQVPFGDYFLYFLLAHHGKLKYLEDNMAVYRSGVGLISNMSEKQMNLNYVKLYSGMISHTSHTELKKLILEKQNQLVNSYYYLIEDKYWLLKQQQERAFVSHHPLFKWIKQIQKVYWKFKNNNKD